MNRLPVMFIPLASFAILASAQTPAPMGTVEPAAAPADSIVAPKFTIGDRWTWNVTDNTRANALSDGCSPGFPQGAQEGETVTQVFDGGHETQVLGPMPNWRSTRVYSDDGTYRARAEGSEVRAGPVRFPLRPGNTWDAMLASAEVVTTLKCEAKAAERLKLSNEEFAVIPIVCNGKWRHIKSGNTNTAEYKYWYSPVVGRSVQHTGLTYYGRGICFNAEWHLDSYTRNK